MAAHICFTRLCCLAADVSLFFSKWLSSNGKHVTIFWTNDKLLCQQTLVSIKYAVEYLLHARTFEPQKQPLLIHAKNSRTGLCNSFLGSDLINALPRRRWRHTKIQQQFSLYPCSLRMRNHVTTQQCLAITWLVLFSVVCCRTVFSALSVPQLCKASPLAAERNFWSSFEIARWLNKKWQENFIVIWSASLCWEPLPGDD
jgi:hypothetical protein